MIYEWHGSRGSKPFVLLPKRTFAFLPAWCINLLTREPSWNTNKPSCTAQFNCWLGVGASTGAMCGVLLPGSSSVASCSASKVHYEPVTTWDCSGRLLPWSSASLVMQKESCCPSGGGYLRQLSQIQWLEHYWAITLSWFLWCKKLVNLRRLARSAIWGVDIKDSLRNILE